MGLSVTNFTIENASGQAVRQDIEACFLALQGQNREANDTDMASSQCVRGMTFLNDTTKILKVRNSSNNGFTDIGHIDQANLGLLPRSGGTTAPMTGQFLAQSGGSVSAPAIAFGDANNSANNDTSTGIYRVSSSIVGVTCGGGTNTNEANFEFSSSSFISREDITLQKTDASDAFLEIRTTGNSNDAYIDLTTDTSSVGQDFGFRFLRQQAATGNSYLHHRSADSNAGSLFILSQGGTNGSIIFGTGGTPAVPPGTDIAATERWRIDPTGCLGSNGLVATSALTNPGAFFNVQNTDFEGLALVKNNNGWGTPLFINRLNPYATGNFLELQSNNTFCGSINTTSGSTTNFNTNVSDRTLKKNFESWSENTLDLFKDLNPQKYNFLHEDDTAEKNKGFIAQELADSFPEAYPQDDKGKYMFNPSGMVIYLMKALQETVAKIETLETKVAALEAS